MRRHLNFVDPPSPDGPSSRSMQVVVGNLVRRVDIDPFDNDVTVTELPYLIPEVRGATSEPFTKICNVRWRLGSGPATPVTSVSGGQRRVVSLPYHGRPSSADDRGHDPFGG